MSSELVVIESHDADGVEWGVSLDGSNPTADKFIKCKSMEEAFRIKHRGRLRENTATVTEKSDWLYHDKMKAKLEAQEGLLERLDVFTQMLANRIEQHEVFGDEVGTGVDYSYLYFARKLLGECQSRIEECEETEGVSD